MSAATGVKSGRLEVCCEIAACAAGLHNPEAASTTAMPTLTPARAASVLLSGLALQAMLLESC